MSLWSKVRTGLDVAGKAIRYTDVCLLAIEIIGDLVKEKPSLDTLDVIGGVVDQVKDVIDGKLDPAKAREAFAAMKADIAKTNADVDAHIDDEFDHSDSDD